MNAPQVGGSYRSAMEDIQMAAKGGVFLILILVIVFPHIVPSEARYLFTNPIGQAVSLLIILLLAILVGFDAAAFGALALLLIWSFHNTPKQVEGIDPMATTESPVKESFQPYIRPSTIVIERPSVKVVPNKQKWFVEQVLKEDPTVLEEEKVRTSAVQDDSERSQDRSSVSR